MVAEEEQGLPGVLERRLDRVDRVGPGRAERPSRLDRPAATAAGRPASGRPSGCSRRRADDPGELAVLDPGGVEHLDVADR